MGAFKYFSFVSTLSLFVAFFALIYHGLRSSSDLKRVTNILNNLLALENNQKYHGLEDKIRPKVAIGYGSCSDLYVRAVNFLNYTEQLAQADFEDFNVDEITTNEEFLRSFAYYFRAGAASERFTPNQEMFRYLVALAKKHHVAEPRWALGGNAPVMGTRFYLEGADVLLAAKMSEKLKSHIQPEIRMIDDYSVDVDDVHLILEYQTGDKWGNLVAPRANRYILHNDQNNPRISSLEEFNKSLASFAPRLFVVSGLQMLDNFPFEEPRDREERLLKVREQMAQVDRATFVHFEMASFVEIELLSFLIDNIIPYADSLGMNEQELDNLKQVLDTGEISLVADSNPRVAATLDQMRTVFVKLNKDYFDHQQVDASRRPLHRLHVHTLAYQAFMVVRTSQFKNTKNAAAKASLTAHRHVCATSSINPGNAHLILDESFATSASSQPNTNAHQLEKRFRPVRTCFVNCLCEELMM